jgi:hypothetical protein
VSDPITKWANRREPANVRLVVHPEVWGALARADWPGAPGGSVFRADDYGRGSTLFDMPVVQDSSLPLNGWCLEITGQVNMVAVP